MAFVLEISLKLKLSTHKNTGNVPLFENYNESIKNLNEICFFSPQVIIPYQILRKCCFCLRNIAENEIIHPRVHRECGLADPSDSLTRKLVDSANLQPPAMAARLFRRRIWSLQRASEKPRLQTRMSEKIKSCLPLIYGEANHVREKRQQSNFISKHVHKQRSLQATLICTELFC